MIESLLEEGKRRGHAVAMGGSLVSLQIYLDSAHEPNLNKLCIIPRRLVNR